MSIISLGVGQAGVQIADTCFQRFATESGIQPDGSMSEEAKESKDPSGHDIFFHEDKAGQFKPRAVLIDTEPLACEAILQGQYGAFYDRETVITGKEEACYYSRGKYSLGRQYIDEVMDQVRLQMEQVDFCQGVLMYHSSSGGTGSGLGGLIAQEMTRIYPRKDRSSVVVYSSPSQSTSVIEPYNTCNTLDWMLENCEFNVFFDNQALNRICEMNLGIPNARYSDLNRIIAQYMSSLTASMRFGGSINSSLASINTDMIPYPRIHLLMGSMAPITSAEQASQVEVSVAGLADAVYGDDCLLSSVSTKDDRCISSNGVFQGAVTTQEMDKVFDQMRELDKLQKIRDKKSLVTEQWQAKIAAKGKKKKGKKKGKKVNNRLTEQEEIKLQRQIDELMEKEEELTQKEQAAMQTVYRKEFYKYADWSPCAQKYGIAQQSSLKEQEESIVGQQRRFASCLTNHTAVRHLLIANDDKWDQLYAKRAFVHWIVGEGFDEGEMTEMRENSWALREDMKEVQMRTDFDSQDDEM